jgi:ferrochelatase
MAPCRTAYIHCPAEATASGRRPRAATVLTFWRWPLPLAFSRWPSGACLLARFRLASVIVSSHSRPFDAVLLISFGGPQGPEEIRPFLQNVLRGRRVPPERLDEVVHHYELFGGISPLTELTMRQAEALRANLDARGLPLPVFVGMRNWHPFLADTLQQMTDAGIRRAVGVIAAAHRSYSSCTQYKHNTLQANAELFAQRHDALTVVYGNDWHLHAGFVDAVAGRIRVARATLPEAVRETARVVFTAHSIPTTMAHAETYQRQLWESADAVAANLGLREWSLAYQSRSGRPQDPWLEPDINAWLRDEATRGLQAVILSPLGFVCDHIEVLYDLDIEAKETCDELGIVMARAHAVNDHPRFVDALADSVADVVDRYRTGRPLPLVSAETPNAIELPPPTRAAR